MKKEDFFKLAERITKEETDRYEEAKELWSRKKEIHKDFLVSNRINSDWKSIFISAQAIYLEII